MIAFEFGMSINTVGNIAANAYKKLGVHGAAAGSRTQMRTCGPAGPGTSRARTAASSTRSSSNRRILHKLGLSRRAEAAAYGEAPTAAVAGGPFGP